MNNAQLIQQLESALQSEDIHADIKKIIFSLKAKPPIGYFKFFKVEMNTKFHNTKRIIESMLNYKYLLVRRYAASKQSNDDYWFLINAFDMITSEYQFTEMIAEQDKLTELVIADKLDMIVSKLQNMLEGNINEQERRSVNIFRDSNKLFTKWLIELDVIVLRELFPQ